MNISITVKAAIKYFGSKAQIARVLGIKPQSVNSWGDSKIPEPSASRLYIITDGKLGDKVEHEVPKRKNSILQ